MSYNKLIAIVVILIVVLQIATADNGGEKKEISEEELKELGTGVSGEKVGDTYYIKSGAVTGDLSGKKVVVSSDGSVVIGEEMKGTIAVQGGTITLPPPSNRKARGTGTCDNSGCTFLSGESGEGNERVSDGSFRVKNDGTVDVLTSATIGGGDKSFEITNVQNLRFDGGKITGVTVDDSEIAGNIVGNKANFEYDAETKELGLTKPEGVAEDYKVKVDKFAKDAAISGENILFEDPETPAKELIKGKVSKESDKHLVYGDSSKFINEHNAVFTVTKEISYVADFKLPDDVKDNYIKSDIDEKAGVTVLSVFSRAGNDIEVRVGEEPPYEMVDLDNFGSEVKIIKEGALVKENGNKISITNKETIVKSDEKGRLSANTIYNLKITYRSMRISKEGTMYDYVSSDGVGTCWFDCKKIITSIGETKISRFTELVKSKEISVDDITKQLTSKYYGEKREVLAYIIETKDPRAVDSLIELSKKETEDPTIRRMAIQALGEIKDLKATEALVGIIKNRDEYVREGAIVALGNMKDPRAVEVFARIIEDKDEDAILKLNVISALGKIGDPQVIEPLSKALKDKNPDLRREAVIALGKTKDPKAIELLIKALKDKHVAVGNEAIATLGETENPKATEALVEIIENRGEDLSLRKSAMFILGRRGDPKAIEPLLKSFEDKDLSVEAMMALRRIKGPESTLAIGQYLSKENYKIDINNLVNNVDALEKIRNEKPDPKDVYLLSILPVTDIEFDRKILEKSLDDELKKHEHTMRSETGGGIGYKEDFDSWKDRLTSTELKKIEVILTSMNAEETRNQIGKLIQADLRKGETTISGVKKDGTEGTFKIKSDKTEIGGLIFLDKDKNMVFTPYEPSTMRNNKKYDAPLKSYIFSPSFAGFHLHAIMDDDPGHAGPSGGDTGDLANGKSLNLDGILITPIGENKFNVDYYTPDEKVVDIGNYEYKQ